MPWMGLGVWKGSVIKKVAHAGCSPFGRRLCWATYRGSCVCVCVKPGVWGRFRATPHWRRGRGATALEGSRRFRRKSRIGYSSAARFASTARYQRRGGKYRSQNAAQIKGWSADGGTPCGCLLPSSARATTTVIRRLKVLELMPRVLRVSIDRRGLQKTDVTINNTGERRWQLATACQIILAFRPRSPRKPRVTRSGVWPSL